MSWGFFDVMETRSAGRGKGEISEGIWDLDQAGTEKAKQHLAANPESLLRSRLLLAAVPPLEWEAARNDPQRRSQPA